MALVVLLGDAGWWVVCAACCHMALLYSYALISAFKSVFIVSVHLGGYIFVSSGINKLDRLVEDTSMFQPEMPF